MPTITRQQQLFTHGERHNPLQSNVTIGQVVDTNDPQQMGRIRVICPQWGDSLQAAVADLPWAIYMSPFGGQTQVSTRGPGIQTSSGGIAYGTWWIPKVNAQVAVMCVDGNPMNRMYIGCIYDQFTPHTMPHGRYMYDDHPALEKSGTDAAPYGPYTSMEQFIHPLNENQKAAFGNKSEPNFEYRNRGADYTVAGVGVDSLNRTYSSVQDDKEVVHDGWTSTQGYQTSRSDPNVETQFTDKNYDSHVYSITSPGFHAFSMDDRQENCRMRFRTAAGHQIILDDTNERIYIATAQGNNWIELDQNGTIDMYSANKVNIHSMRDLNLTSDETIRLSAKNGIHLASNQEIRMTAATSVEVKGGTDVNVSASNVINIKASSNLNLESGSIANVKAAGSYRATAGTIHFNSSSAPAAGANQATPAFVSSRVPTHEPFARTSTLNDNTMQPEFAYDDPRVNREERGVRYDRSMYWRR